MTKVLIVDDERGMRNTMRQFLEMEGYAVTVAEDAAIAIDHLGGETFDVVVTDIVLPRISGVALLRTIHAIDPRIKVVLITGEPTVDTTAAAIRSGAYDYLTKPVSRDRLCAVVNAAVGLKKLEDENLQYRDHLETLVEERTEELRESEQRYRLLAEHVSDIIWLMDNDLTMQYCSPSVEKIEGYTPAEAMAMRLDQYVPPDSMVKVMAIFQEEMAREASGEGKADPYRSRILEMQHICKDGRIIWVEVIVSFVRDENLDVTGFVGVTRDISERKEAQSQLTQSYEKLNRALDGVIKAMALTVETRDPYTSGHQRRVADLAAAIAREMDLPDDTVEAVTMAAAIHDIGKIAIPAEILSKPGKLSDIEFDIIRTHCNVGYEILKPIDFPWPLADIVMQHHERLDGSGYPNGLSRGGILPEALIIMVADVVEAIASHRPYRPALGIDAALAEILDYKDVRYDATVVDACIRVFKDNGYSLII